MRGVVAAVKKFFVPVKGKQGAMAITIPKKQLNKNAAEGQIVKEEKVDPIVACSRPPPLPPVLGSLVVLSLLDSYSSHDNDD